MFQSFFSKLILLGLFLLPSTLLAGEDDNKSDKIKIIKPRPVQILPPVVAKSSQQPNIQSIHYSSQAQVAQDQLPPQLEYFAQRMTELDRASGKGEMSYGAALANLIQDRRIIPQNATIHVVGPYLSSSEWLIYLLLRKDVTVIVSEQLYDPDDPKGFREKSFEEERIHQWVKGYSEDPQLKDLLSRSERSPEELINLINNRGEKDSKLIEAYSLGNQPARTKDAREVPLADFVFAMMPQHGGRNLYPHYGKKNALGWVITESFSSRYEQGAYATPTQLMVIKELPKSELNSFGDTSQYGPLNLLRKTIPDCPRYFGMFGGYSVFHGLGTPYVFMIK